MNLKGNEKVDVEKSGKGAKESFYSVKIKDEATNNEFYMDITGKGGYPIWVMNNREIKEQKVSLNDAGSKGLKFLKDISLIIWSFMIAHNMIMLVYLRM